MNSTSGFRRAAFPLLVLAGSMVVVTNAGATCLGVKDDASRLACYERQAGWVEFSTRCRYAEDAETALKCWDERARSNNGGASIEHFAGTPFDVAAQIESDSAWLEESVKLGQWVFGHKPRPNPGPGAATYGEYYASGEMHTLLMFSCDPDDGITLGAGLYGETKKVTPVFVELDGAGGEVQHWYDGPFGPTYPFDLDAFVRRLSGGEKLFLQTPARWHGTATGRFSMDGIAQAYAHMKASCQI